MAKDCGKERCCLGGKICSPLLFKYVPCNLKVSAMVNLMVVMVVNLIMMEVMMVVNSGADNGNDDKQYKVINYNYYIIIYTMVTCMVFYTAFIAVKESLYVIKHSRFSQNFCFDFLGVYDIYIDNSFVNKATRWV